MINESKGKQKMHCVHYQCIPIINHRHSSTSTGSAEEVNNERSTLESSLVELRCVHYHDSGCVSPLSLTDVYDRSNGMEKTPG